MTLFRVKFFRLNFANKLHHFNSAKILGKFCLDKFSPNSTQFEKKGVLNFKFNAFCPVNLNQHRIAAVIGQAMVEQKLEFKRELVLTNFHCHGRLITGSEDREGVITMLSTSMKKSFEFLQIENAKLKILTVYETSIE